MGSDRRASRPSSDRKSGWGKLGDWLHDSGPLTLLTGIAFAGSLGHIVKLAHENGQSGWDVWATAACVDLLCMMAANERQLDKRTQRVRKGLVSWPTLVLILGIVTTLGANLATAKHTAWGFILSGLPGFFLLLAVSMIERRASHSRSGSGTGAAQPGLAGAASSRHGSAARTVPVPEPDVPAAAGSGTGARNRQPEGAGTGTGARNREPAAHTATASLQPEEAGPARRHLHSEDAIEAQARDLAATYEAEHHRPIPLTDMQTGLKAAGMPCRRQEVGRLRRLALGLEEESA